MYATRAGAGGGAPLISSRSGSFHSARHPVGSRGVDVSAASAALLPQPPPAVRGARLSGLTADGGQRLSSPPLLGVSPVQGFVMWGFAEDEKQRQTRFL